MCGIAGFCNEPENWKENITKMISRLSHRGPDAEGVWACEAADVVLGHRRLAILDLSVNGAQPMISASGRFVLVLNGEIYNFGKIAKKLLDEKKVAFFRGHSDTEVLLEAVEAYGFEKAIKLSKGMFAVAAYDRLERKLYLARDRAGEKPLYYGFIGKVFLFASEITAIRVHDKFTPQLDQGALSLYFRYGYIPAPYSVYKDIRKLEAGCILEVDAPFVTARQYRYWSALDVAGDGQAHPFRGSLEDAADELERLLKEAVKEQMVADVPVGAFLSGGTDSTAVVAFMQEEASHKVKTFSIGFREEDYNEAVYAKKTAEYLGTDHTELYLSDGDAMKVIPLLPQMFGEPFADSSQIPTYLVSKLAREQVTVSLSGDAGDELFCGYDSYESNRKKWEMFRHFPLPLRKAAGKVLNQRCFEKMEYIWKIGHYLPAASPEELMELNGSLIVGTDRIVMGQPVTPPCQFSLYPQNAAGARIENNLSLMDFLMYLPDDILVKVDRAGMAVSLESRMPLLDRDIIEFSWKLPPGFKIDGKDRKKVLKKVLYRHVPEEMMLRPKQGFATPVAEWIRFGGLRAWGEELMDADHIKRQGILDATVVQKLWKRFLDTGYGYSKIWSLLMFEQWIAQTGVNVDKFAGIS